MQSSSKVSISIPPTQDPLPSASFHTRPAQFDKPSAKKGAAGAPRQSYVRQEQQQAATDEAAEISRLEGHQEAEVLQKVVR